LISPAKKGFFKLLLLHRRIGLVVIWLVLWLAITGVLLNHSNDLNLDGIALKYSWLQKLYGLESEPSTMAYPMGGDWLLALPGAYYLEGQIIEEDYGQLIGGLKLKDSSLLVTNESVVVLDQNAEVLEVLGVFHGLEGEFLKVGLYRGQPLLKTSKEYYLASMGLLEWGPFSQSSAEVKWSTLKPMPEILLNKIRELERSDRPAVSLERVILDLHSGRLFGRLSWLFMDIFALLLITGSISGFVIWFKLRVKI
jgi:hypothetical protein